MSWLWPRDNRRLEFRSGQLETIRGAKLATTSSWGENAPILVLDDEDDDEVVVSSSTSFPRPRGATSQQGTRGPVINEEDLELRLGFAATSGMVRTSADHNPRRKNNRVPASNAIDLCDEAGETDQNFNKMRKNGQVGSDVPVNESKEVKLTCPICMCAMEEETSTTCGHIFCQKCIKSAIQLQKKCPTCRKKLTSSQIHRIYLSSSTD